MVCVCERERCMTMKIIYVKPNRTVLIVMSDKKGKKVCSGLTYKNNPLHAILKSTRSHISKCLYTYMRAISICTFSFAHSLAFSLSFSLSVRRGGRFHWEILITLRYVLFFSFSSSLNFSLLMLMCFFPFFSSSAWERIYMLVFQTEYYLNVTTSTAFFF